MRSGTGDRRMRRLPALKGKGAARGVALRGHWQLEFAVGCSELLALARADERDSD